VLPVFSHEVKTSRWPYMTICLIGLNVLMFAFEVTVGARFVPFLQEWGVVPGRIQAEITGHNVLTVGSSMFLHVGLVHLLGNMWFLYVFGDAVEDAFGPWWYLGLYLVSGFFGTMVFVATAGKSPLPAIGASGAVSGVMAASLLLWPGAKLKTPGVFLLLYIIGLLYELMVVIGTPSWLLGGGLSFVVLTFGSMLLTRNAGGFIAGLLHMVALPSWAVVGFFMTVQLFNGLLVVVNPAFAGAVGYWAHIGGFAAGALLAWVFPKHPKLLAERPLLG
jgi:membrane associated rhomboid family serine protease